jgi:hypothetical protein
MMASFPSKTRINTLYLTFLQLSILCTDQVILMPHDVCH